MGGPINVKFTHTGDRRVDDFSVKFVDGHCRVLLMQSIVAFCAELEFNEKALQDEQLAAVLSTFVSIPCCYEHFEHASQYFLASLRISPKFEVICFLWLLNPIRPIMLLFTGYGRLETFFMVVCLFSKFGTPKLRNRIRHCGEAKPQPYIYGGGYPGSYPCREAIRESSCQNPSQRFVGQSCGWIQSSLYQQKTSNWISAAQFGVQSVPRSMIYLFVGIGYFSNCPL